MANECDVIYEGPFRGQLNLFKLETVFGWKKHQKILGMDRPKAREGVIIEWPLNGQFHGAVTDILTSRTDVIQVVVNVGNDVTMILG